MRQIEETQLFVYQVIMQRQTCMIGTF